MTCCIGIHLAAGVVFLSDSRTNAGVDQVSTFRKMRVYENPGERVIVLMSAGNLSITQSVLQALSEQAAFHEKNIWSAASMYEVAQLAGEAVRTVHQREARSLAQFGVEFNTTLLVGGQIRGERHRLFQIYAAGNFIESSQETPFLHIGEGKYSKAILERMVDFQSDLDGAAKAALIGMDATLRLNVSVGMPLDLLVYQADTLAVTRFMAIDENHQYFKRLRNDWAAKMRTIAGQLEAPAWNNEAGKIPAFAPGTALRAPPPEQADFHRTGSMVDQMAAQQEPLQSRQQEIR